MDICFTNEQCIVCKSKIEEKPWFSFDNLSNWEDELYRMRIGDLNYEEFIGYDMERLTEVREAFEAMGPGTY